VDVSIEGTLALDGDSCHIVASPIAHLFRAVELSQRPRRADQLLHRPGERAAVARGPGRREVGVISTLDPAPSSSSRRIDPPFDIVENGAATGFDID
jgi:hypothetical protein